VGDAECQMHKYLSDTQKKTKESKLGHATRNEQILEKEWEQGNIISCKQKRYRARKHVMDAITTHSQKSMECALDLINYAMRKVKIECNAASLDFDELSVVSQNRFCEHKTIEGMICKAKECIKFMKCRIDKETIQILTGVSAMFLPSKDSGQFTAACRLLGLKRDAKYVSRGLENRESYDWFQTRTGDIAVGDEVVCRDGHGVLAEITDNSVSILLAPWDFKKQYSPKRSHCFNSFFVQTMFDDKNNNPSLRGK
jgi:hypothetical protein